MPLTCTAHRQEARAAYDCYPQPPRAARQQAARGGGNGSSGAAALPAGRSPRLPPARWRAQLRRQIICAVQRTSRRRRSTAGETLKAQSCAPERSFLGKAAGPKRAGRVLAGKHNDRSAAAS